MAQFQLKFTEKIEDYDMKKKLLTCALGLLMLLAIAMPYAKISADQAETKVDIMFLHDTHSHLNAFTTVEGAESVTMGGFARIKTLINAQKEKNP